TMTAYMFAFPDFAAFQGLDLLVVLLWLPAIESGQKRNCRGFSGLGSTIPTTGLGGSAFGREPLLQPLLRRRQGGAGRGCPRFELTRKHSSLPSQWRGKSAC